jgi:hypothetical protein
MIGSTWEIVFACLTTVVAVPLVTAGLVGHGLAPIRVPLRLLAVFVGLAALLPAKAWTGALTVDLVAVGSGLALIAWHVHLHSRNIAKSTPNASVSNASRSSPSKGVATVE